MKKILIAEPDDFSPAVIHKLQQIAHVDAIKWNIENLKEALETYDVFWFRLKWKIDQTVLNGNSKCKILATPVTGIDHIDEALCEKLNVKIVCLRGEREFLKEVRATSELAIALAFSVMRGIPQAHGSVKSGIWDRDLFRGYELYKKKAGIIGMGRLGQIIADYFIAFGMDVFAYEVREHEKHPGVKYVSSLEELANQSDLVSLHVNYTEATHNLIDGNFFNAMKNTAYFINTSRGGIVNEMDLISALKSNNIAGAGIDVIQNELNFNANNPLVKYAQEQNNLIITPHIGGNTYESFQKTENFIADKVIQQLKSLPS